VFKSDDDDDDSKAARTFFCYPNKYLPDPSSFLALWARLWGSCGNFLNFRRLQLTKKRKINVFLPKKVSRDDYNFDEKWLR
jgi:hypothetical protein